MEFWPLQFETGPILMEQVDIPAFVSDYPTEQIA